MRWFLPATLVAVAVADQAVKAALLARRPAGVGTGTGPVRVAVATARPTFAGRLGVPAPVLAAAWLACLAAAVALWPATGRFGTATAQAALGAALGGAAANLLDVVARGGVVDWLAVGRWPAFNLADAAIVAGLALAVVAG